MNEAVFLNSSLITHHSSLLNESLVNSDRPPRPCRFVDRLDNRHRLSSFLAVHQGFAALADRSHEVGQLPGVALMRDRRGIARSARGAGLLRVLLLDLPICLRFR